MAIRRAKVTLPKKSFVLKRKPTNPTETHFYLWTCGRPTLQHLRELKYKWDIDELAGILDQLQYMQKELDLVGQAIMARLLSMSSSHP